MSVQIVLVHPQIAPNTGNIIRLCANIGAQLHLVEPLGFSLNDRLLRRGGLDYHELTTVTLHADVDAARAQLPGRWLALTTGAQTRYDQHRYAEDDVLVFGCEATGLPAAELARFARDDRLGIPMAAGSRSLNLGNAVAVVAYEAWRQRGFPGAAVDAPAPVEALGRPPPAPPPA